MKHTPGPWKAAKPKHDPQAWDVCTESGGVLAKLPWGGEGGANAKLMAAAPDMLEALESILSYHRFDISDEDVSRVVAAIEKATSSATGGGS